MKRWYSAQLYHLPYSDLRDRVEVARGFVPLPGRLSTPSGALDLDLDPLDGHRVRRLWICNR